MLPKMLKHSHKIAILWPTYSQDHTMHPKRSSRKLYDPAKMYLKRQSVAHFYMLAIVHKIGRNMQQMSEIQIHLSLKMIS